MKHVPVILVLCGVVGWGGLALTLARANGAAQQSMMAGERMYKGEEPLQAHISGYSQALSSEASRCSNCHSNSDSSSMSEAQTPQLATAVAPALTAESLTREAARRGGPASRFDEDSFCRLLRSGVDPAYVVVPRTMPRYDMSEAQCRDLWRYITGETS